MLTKEQVLEKIEKGESFKGVEIGDIDFSRHVFEKIVEFGGAIFKREVNFEKAEFKELVSFTSAEFEDKVFFRNVKAKKQILFGVTRFHNEVGFENANFYSDVLFVGAYFLNKANFKFSKFENAVSFLTVTFKGDAIFQNVQFHDEVTFNNTIFINKTDYSNSIFKGQTIFIYTKFEKDVDFSNVYFNSITRFIGHREKKIKLEKMVVNSKFDEFKSIKETCLVFSENDNTDLRGVTFGQPEKVVFRTIDMSRCLLLNTNLSKVELADVQWSKYKNRSVIYDEIYEDEKEEKNYALIEKVYSQLKKNLEESRNYVYAGDFHYGEMEMRRKRHWGIFKHISFTSFYKYFSGYGEKYWWAIGVLAFFILLFTFIYMCMGLDIMNAFIHTLQVALLQSNLKVKLVSDWGTLVEILERLMIIIQATLVVLAFRRKFRR